MNEETDPSDFWYINGKTRLWKSYEEYLWRSGRMKSVDLHEF